jgi:ferric enterobactin receptor
MITKIIRSLSMLFLLSAIAAFAQNKAAADLKGYVRDEKSGEPLPYADVWITGTSTGTNTNTDGYFVIVSRPIGKISLSVRYIGYMPLETLVDNQANSKPVAISLAPTTLEVEGITVTAQAEMLRATEKISQVTISPQQLSSLPNIGEADVFRTLQLLPGVSAVSDGSSGLYVRGGTPDQNLILFDGMTIYHVDHFFGFFSAFNADAIKDIQLLKGGFGAEYGGRLSSVVNLTGKTGDQNRLRFGCGLNLLSANASLELPVSRWGNLLIAGRRSYTDFIRSSLYNKIYNFVTGDQGSGATGSTVRPSGGGPDGSNGGFGGPQQTEVKPSFYFYDLNGKFTARPGRKDILTLSIYSGKDNLDQSQDFSQMSLREPGSDQSASLSTTDYTRWGNRGISAKWARQWHDRLQMDLLFARSDYFSDYDRGTSLGTSSIPAAPDSGSVRRDFSSASKESNNVLDHSAKLNLDWQIAANHRLGFGYHLSGFDNKYNSSRNDSIAIFSRNRTSLLQSLYLQDVWKISALKVTPGVRVSYYDRTDKFYTEPRFSFSLPLFRQVNFQAAWGQYYQFVNQIANENVTQGARNFWLLADEDFAPSFAEHCILGLNYENSNYVFSVEGYYKKLRDLIEFSRRYIGRGTPGSRSAPVENFYVGDGKAKGIEFLLQKKQGALTGWVGYTLGQVKHQFPLINDGLAFPADHDRRHNVTMVAKYSRGLYTFAATWVFASGNPYTAPESQYFIMLLNGTVLSYIHVSGRNANRQPDYHRLDLSASRKFEFGRWSADLGVSVFNAYNHKNIWYKDYNLQTVPVTVTDVLMLGFTPTVFIEMKLK